MKLITPCGDDCSVCPRYNSESEVELQLPSAEHKIRAEEFKAEFFSNGEEIINGSSLYDKMEFDDWLEYVTKNRDPERFNPDWVQATTFFAVRKSDGKIIGVSDLRHNLDNPFLKEYGGHIGYAVRPSERNKGYASDMLFETLAYAKSLGLEKVMIGCYSDNFASIKVIERCGGILSETKPYSDGKPMRIYCVKL